MKPEAMFLVIATVFGLLMLVFSLPFRGPDELIHFYKAYSISEGNILCQIQVPPDAEERQGSDRKWVGNEIPHTIQVTADRTVQDVSELPIPPQAIPSALDIPMRSSPRAFVNYSAWSSIAMYSPVAYLPQAAGILVGRIFSASPVLLLYLGRFFNLLVWMLLVYLSIRTTPVQKWTMLLVAVMPLTVNLAASMSSDGMAIGLSFLFIACVLRIAFGPDEEALGGKQFGVLVLLLLLMALCKPPYFLLVFLFLLIPAGRLKGRKRYAAAFGILTASTFTTVILWNLLVRSAYVTRLATISTGPQISYILENPLGFAWTMMRTAYTFKTFWLKTFVGGIGFLEVNLPTVFLASYLMILVAVAVLDEAKRGPSVRERGVSLAVFLGCSAVMLATFYVTWTPVGQRIIDGFQARYVIPIAPLLLLVLANKRFTVKRDWVLPSTVLAYSCVSVFITMFYMIRTYF